MNEHTIYLLLTMNITFNVNTNQSTHHCQYHSISSKSTAACKATMQMHNSHYKLDMHTHVKELI